MPRPLTKEDIATFKTKVARHAQFKYLRCEPLGYIIQSTAFGIKKYAYQIAATGVCWVSERAYRKRLKIGHPAPRKRPVKQMLREPDFGLEEMALAEAIMNGG